MYESFFGLRERPFDLTPNPRFLFLSDRQREALSTLRFSLTAARGLVLLVGEAGTGKTTLVEAALADKPSEDAECVLLSNPALTRNEFFEFLANAFNVAHETGDSKTRFLIALRRHVEARHARGQITALIIDEAQSLSHELLEEVRLLSNIETPTSKLLTVVLAGQPELADRLNDPKLRQLKQRVGLRCELSTLTTAETAAYIAGRLRIAGASPVQVFTREAVLAIYQGSGGVPRVINVICENALISGFASQTKPISRAIVSEVLRDFDLETVTANRAPVGAATQPHAVAAPVSEPAEPEAIEAGDSQNPALLFGTGRRNRRFTFFG